MHGFIEFIGSFPVQSPLEDLTHISAGQSKVDVIVFIVHRILSKHEPAAVIAGGRGHTLIVVRRTQADAKAIWAGGIPQASFATLSAWINPSRADRATSRRFDRWDLENILGNGGGCEESVTRGRKEELELRPMEPSDHFASWKLADRRCQNPVSVRSSPLILELERQHCVEMALALDVARNQRVTQSPNFEGLGCSFTPDPLQRTQSGSDCCQHGSTAVADVKPSA